MENARGPWRRGAALVATASGGVVVVASARPQTAGGGCMGVPGAESGARKTDRGREGGTHRTNQGANQTLGNAPPPPGSWNRRNGSIFLALATLHGGGRAKLHISCGRGWYGGRVWVKMWRGEPGTDGVDGQRSPRWVDRGGGDFVGAPELSTGVVLLLQSPDSCPSGRCTAASGRGCRDSRQPAGALVAEGAGPAGAPPSWMPMLETPIGAWRAASGSPDGAAGGHAQPASVLGGCWMPVLALRWLLGTAERVDDLRRYVAVTAHKPCVDVMSATETSSGHLCTRPEKSSTYENLTSDGRWPSPR